MLRNFRSEVLPPRGKAIEQLHLHSLGLARGHEAQI